MNSRFVARAAICAALYAALTLAPGLNALAYGQVQFRLSEALLVFACVDPAAVVGLAVGTALGNLNSSLGPADVLFGSLLTFIAALGMYRIGLHWWALAVPVFERVRFVEFVQHGTHEAGGPLQELERYAVRGIVRPVPPRQRERERVQASGVTSG